MDTPNSQPTSSSPQDQDTSATPQGDPIDAQQSGDDKVAAAPAADGAPAPPLTIAMQELETKIIEMMMTVFDPEIPVNIYELGMVYNVDVTEPGDVHVKMTLTSPSCPVAGSLPGEVEAKVKAVEGVKSAKLDLVWDPPWNPSMMSDAAKLQLGMM